MSKSNLICQLTPFLRRLSSSYDRLFYATLHSNSIYPFYGFLKFYFIAEAEVIQFVIYFCLLRYLSSDPFLFHQTYLVRVIIEVNKFLNVGKLCIQIWIQPYCEKEITKLHRNGKLSHVKISPPNPAYV